MNSLIFISAVCLLAAVSVTAEEFSRKDEFVKQCKSELNADDEVAKIMDNKVVPETEAQKCFLDCIYKKMGLVKDGKLDHEGAKKVAERKFGNDPEKLKKADELFEQCVGVVEAEAVKDACYFGKAIRQCFVSKGNNILQVFSTE